MWNKTEFYTYLNGLKVGIYTESEASDFTLNKGKENKGSEGRESEDKAEKIFRGGPETHNYYCSYDGQGNVSQVSNMAGDEPYSLYAYDSYGTQTGSDCSNDSFSSYKGYDKGPFGNKTGVRQYDPETGRFLSPDAFKGYLTDPASQHPYMYCKGNPVTYSDPSGYDVTKIEIYYKKATATVYFDDKKPIDIPIAVGESHRISPGTKMYIRQWLKDATYGGFENTKIPWSKNNENPYGPYYAELTRDKSLRTYDNPWNCQLHGTGGGIPKSIYEKDSITFVDDETGKETRAFTHGCTRCNNKAIEMLNKETRPGTPVLFFK